MFQAASIIVVLAGLASFFNAKILKLPTTIGVTLIALVCSLALIALGGEADFVRHGVAELLGRLHFDQTVLHGMLAFLLFAGALHLDLNDLGKQWAIVSLLAFVGTLLTAALVGCAMHIVFAALRLDVAWLECFLFGALIAPTDPVAVLGMMKSLHAPKALETQMAGESLFNDGVGVVLFLALLAAITDGHLPTAGKGASMFIRDVGGALFVGLVCGGAAFQLLKRIDNYQVEVLLTLSLAMGCYALAEALDVSAPIAVVVAGLLTGNQGRAFAMSARTKQRLDEFWELIDDILNVVLFMLVGMQILVLPARGAYALIGIAAVSAVVAARWLSVAGIISAARGAKMRIPPGTIRILTWGGLRGGLSLAMALALPSSVHADLLRAAAYSVVVFSVLVQGLTIAPLVRKLAAASH